MAAAQSLVIFAVGHSSQRDDMTRTLSHTIEAGVRTLKRTDPILARIVRDVGPCRLKRSASYFVTLVEAVIWQQLSWHAASKIHARLLDVLGTQRPRPRDILETRRSRLLSAGLSRQKCEYLKELAVTFESKGFASRLGSLSDEEVIERLRQIKGIGVWSAEMFLIFGLNRLDVFPLGDLGLRKAVELHYGFGETMSDEDITSVADVWRPYRTLAAWYLWASSDDVPTRKRNANPR